MASYEGFCTYIMLGSIKNTMKNILKEIKDFVLGSIKNIVRSIKNILKEIEGFFVSQPVLAGILLLLIPVRVYEGLVYGLESISFDSRSSTFWFAKLLVYDLDSMSFDGMFNTIYAIIATLYIAPIIAIYYWLQEKSSFLAQVDIQYHLRYKIFGIASLAIIGLSSQSLFCQALITFVLLCELTHISLLLNDLVSGNISDKGSKYFAKLIGKQSDLTKVIEKIHFIRQKLSWLSDARLFDFDKMKTISFGPVKSVSVNKKKFERFLKHIKDELKPDKQDKEVTIPYYFNFEAGRFFTDDRGLFIAIYHNSYKNFNKDTENKFNKRFEQCFDTIPPKDTKTVKAFKNYIDNLKINILYLIEQKNFPKFREELDQIISILDKIKEEKLLYRDLNDLIFKIRQVVKSTNKFNEYKLLKDKLFEFCISLFATCIDSKYNQYMEMMFYLIVECFESNIFKGGGDDTSDLKKFEQEVTSVINYCKSTENFFISYIQVLNKFVRENIEDLKNDTQFNRFHFASSLLGYLSDDLEKNKLYNITPELKSDVTKYLQKTLIFLTALLERDKNSNENKERYESEIINFIKRIYSDQLIENLYELFHHSLPEFDPLYRLESSMPEPNRHGFSESSMKGNYTPEEVYSIFLRKYIEYNPKFIEQVLEQVQNEPHKYYTLKPLFKSLLEKINDKDDTHKNIISKIIKLYDDKEKEKIIQANLSEDKTEKFINELHKGYDDTGKISKHCKQSCETQSIKNFSKMKKIRLGKRVPKEWFIEDPSSNISTTMVSQDIGRYIAQRENYVIFNQLYKEIKNKTQHEKLNRNDFDREKILSKWKGKDDSYVILTNIYSYNFSNIKNIPKVNYIDWNKKLDSRRFCMLVKKDDIHLDFVLWDKDPHYNDHTLEHHKSISYKITDLAKDEECRQYIAKNNTDPNLSKDKLMSKVAITIYLCPEINEKKSDFSKIELVELTNPQT